MNKYAIIGGAVTGILLALGIIISAFQKVPPASDHLNPRMVTQTTGRSMVGFYQNEKGVTPIAEDRFKALVDTTFPFNQLKPKDAIVYRQRMWLLGDKNLVHHAVYSWAPGFTAVNVKGYANADGDGQVSEIDYVGKVVAIETSNGFVSIK